MSLWKKASARIKTKVKGALQGGGRAGYTGDYRSWEEARHASTGYDGSAILGKVRDALLKVKSGEAVYERDSVLFDRIEYAWPVLAALLWVASQRGNRLRLIDFGGSLGSTYYQNLGFLDHLEELTWSIVEQENYVACGREHFADARLGFFLSIEESLQQRPCDVVLLASVLPYVEKPYQLLQTIVEQGIDFIVIDRTPVLSGTEERLTVQTVPAEIYQASYPAWFLSRQRILAFMAPDYDLVAEFDSLVPRIDLGGACAQEKGFIFRKKGTGPSGGTSHA